MPTACTPTPAEVLLRLNIHSGHRLRGGASESAPVKSPSTATDNRCDCEAVRGSSQAVAWIPQERLVRVVSVLRVSVLCDCVLHVTASSLAR